MLRHHLSNKSLHNNNPFVLEMNLVSLLYFLLFHTTILQINFPMIYKRSTHQRIIFEIYCFCLSKIFHEKKSNLKIQIGLMHVVRIRIDLIQLCRFDIEQMLDMCRIKENEIVYGIACWSDQMRKKMEKQAIVTNREHFLLVFLVIHFWYRKIIFCFCFIPSASFLYLQSNTYIMLNKTLKTMASVEFFFMVGYIYSINGLRAKNIVIKKKEKSVGSKMKFENA